MKLVKRVMRVVPALVVATLFATGCGGGEPQAGGGEARSSSPGAAEPTVELTGHMVEVAMISDPRRGEVFDPEEVTVQHGDVVRFVLQSGVHNASFPADKNPQGARLPGATPMMQLPGQTHDLTIDLPPGRYYFQCDPHVALGMIGYINVTE